jgi:hypothetical protein
VSVTRIGGPTRIPSVIAALEEALELAKRGELTGVVVIGTVSGQIFTKWGGIWSAPDTAWAVDVWRAQAITAALDNS